MRFILPVLLLLAAAAAPATAQTEPPPPTREQLDLMLTSTWYGIYSRSKKIGYAHVNCERKGSGKSERLRNTIDMRFKYLSEGKKMDMRLWSVEEFLAQPPYTLVELRERETFGPSEVEKVITRDRKGYQLLLREAGRIRKLRRPPLRYTFIDSVSESLWVLGRPKVGAVLKSSSLDLDRWRLDRDTTTVKSVKDTTIQGVKTRIHEVSIKSGKDGSISLAWVDGKGVLLRVLQDGDDFEMRLEPKKKARQLKYSADPFVSGQATIDRLLGEPDRVTRLKLRVEGKGAKNLRDGPHQTVTRKGGKTVVEIDVLQGRREKAKKEHIAEFLEATLEVPAKHPTIVRLAKRAVGSAKTPRQKVDRLVHFVSAYIEDALNQDSISTLEIVERRVGDCTEHAALFMALSRAVGVPCRTAEGLMYMGDEEKAFGGHAWNEVVIDGYWVPVDSTWDQTRVDATHVRFFADGEPSVDPRVTFKLIDFDRRTKRRR